MQDAHSSHPGNDETAGDAYAGRPVSAAEPGVARALSYVDSGGVWFLPLGASEAIQNQPPKPVKPDDKPGKTGA